MPANVRSWSQQALGYPISPQQFLYSSQLQVQIIDYKLHQYWQQALASSSGDRDIAVRRVAAHWYSGKPESYTSTRPHFYRGHRYPSIAQYCNSIWQKYYHLYRFAFADSSNSNNYWQQPEGERLNSYTQARWYSIIK